MVGLEPIEKANYVVLILQKCGIPKLDVNSVSAIVSATHQYELNVII